MEISVSDTGGSVSLSDEAIVGRVLAGERALFEILMRRHNQQIYRVVRSVVKDEADVEDVMQQAYVSAFTHLKQFEERAQFSTWLTRIALNEAFARRRMAQRAAARTGGAENDDDHEELMDSLTAPQADPERQAYAQELHRVLEIAVDALPEHYRAVFMLRQIEGLSTSETAAGLGLGDEAVKTRLHRARALVRRAVAEHIGQASAEAFQFHAVRCDRVVAAVMSQLSRA